MQTRKTPIVHANPSMGTANIRQRERRRRALTRASTRLRFGLISRQHPIRWRTNIGPIRRKKTARRLLRSVTTYRLAHEHRQHHSVRYLAETSVGRSLRILPLKGG